MLNKIHPAGVAITCFHKATTISPFHHLWISTVNGLIVYAQKNQTFHPRSFIIYPNSKVHGANMGPIWGRQDPGGPHIGPTNFAIWVQILYVPVINAISRRIA